MTLPPFAYAPRVEPTLHRASKYLRWTSVLALVVIVLFVVSVFYSLAIFATEGHVQVSDGSSLHLEEPSPGSYEVPFQVNITNPGLYALDLDVSASLGIVGEGRLASLSTGSVSVAPHGATTPVVLTFTLGESALGADDGELLTHGASLTGSFYLNGSYATVFTFGVAAQGNTSWGAPFEDLAVAPGAPSEAGGTTTVPFTLSFTDASPISDGGSLVLQVVNGGSDCGAATTLDLDVASGASYAQTSDVSGPSSCMTPSASIDVTYSDGPLSVALPPEGLS